MDLIRSVWGSTISNMASVLQFTARTERLSMRSSRRRGPMKRKITQGGAAAAGIVLGVLLNVAPGGAAASPRDARDDVAGPVTVTGCLIEFSAADGEQFVLANVKS